MSHHAVLCCALLCFVTLYCAMLNHALLWSMIQCLALLCFATTCSARQCYFMLCCIKLNPFSSSRCLFFIWTLSDASTVHWKKEVGLSFLWLYLDIEDFVFKVSYVYTKLLIWTSPRQCIVRHWQSIPMRSLCHKMFPSFSDHSCIFWLVFVQLLVEFLQVCNSCWLTVALVLYQQVAFCSVSSGVGSPVDPVGPSQDWMPIENSPVLWSIVRCASFRAITLSTPYCKLTSRGNFMQVLCWTDTPLCPLSPPLSPFISIIYRCYRLVFAKREKYSS